MDRSISPRRMTKSSPIARTMKTALCGNRLTRFPAERKTLCGLIAWKTIVMMSKARMTGRTPLSPLRILVSQARNHSPNDWATSSGGTSRVAASAAAVGSGAVSGASARATCCSVGIRSLPAAARRSGGHVIDDALPVEVRGATLGHHAAEMNHGNPVRHLEDVVEIVRDHHDGEAAIAQAADEIKHHLGLHHPERRRWLIEHDQL